MALLTAQYPSHNARMLMLSLNSYIELKLFVTSVYTGHGEQHELLGQFLSISWSVSIMFHFHNMLWNDGRTLTRVHYVLAQCRAEAASYSSLEEPEMGRDGERRCFKWGIILWSILSVLYILLHPVQYSAGGNLIYGEIFTTFPAWGLITEWLSGSLASNQIHTQLYHVTQWVSCCS